MLLGVSVFVLSCADATDSGLDEPELTAGSGGSGGSGGNGGEAGSGAAGNAGSASESSAGSAGTSGSSAGSGGSDSEGQGGALFGGSAGESGSAGDGGDGGSVGGDGGSAGSDGGAAGDGGTASSGGTSGSGGSNPNVPEGWTCDAPSYNAGGPMPACNCNCGVYDPDCDAIDSYVKGCDKGQTCSAAGKCEGPVLSPPKEWVCGSAYYAIGGQVPVCDCGCGAPDPDCSLYQPTMNLTKCGRGQTCGADGTCQGPILEVPASWTCKASKYAEGKTSGTCDCDCGAYDPDCDDVHLKITGCGYKQTCDKQGQCAGEIAPPPANWTCGATEYSDGKLCNCGCTPRDPDCDMDYPDDCGPSAFCGSIKNFCIDAAN